MKMTDEELAKTVHEVSISNVDTIMNATIAADTVQKTMEAYNKKPESNDVEEAAPTAMKRLMKWCATMGSRKTMKFGGFKRCVIPVLDEFDGRIARLETIETRLDMLES